MYQSHRWRRIVDDLERHDLARARPDRSRGGCIGEHFILKKRGRRFLGLCPFHQEKTPSFHVNPDSGLYYCFGCKETGDVFRFLERVEGYTFVEAVKSLAERAGIPIVEEKAVAPSDANRLKREREALYGVMQMAAGWYEQQLREHPEHHHAVAELKRRGLEPASDVVQAFRIGYAPPGWDGLASFLKAQGVSPAIAESVGLLVPRTSGAGYYDRFRHRLMFAVIDVHGRVVCLQRPRPHANRRLRGHRRKRLARQAGAAPRDPPPKYINSPESPIYTKGSHIFGLWQARHAIRRAEHAIVVEGNFDVVSLHARGLENVVAPLGTAFTVEQARLLRRYTIQNHAAFRRRRSQSAKQRARPRDRVTKRRSKQRSPFCPTKPTPTISWTRAMARCDTSSRRRADSSSI